MLLALQERIVQSITRLQGLPAASVRVSLNKKVRQGLGGCRRRAAGATHHLTRPARPALALWSRLC